MKDRMDTLTNYFAFSPSALSAPSIVNLYTSERDEVPHPEFFAAGGGQKAKRFCKEGGLTAGDVKTCKAAVLKKCGRAAMVCAPAPFGKGCRDRRLKWKDCASKVSVDEAAQLSPEAIANAAVPDINLANIGATSKEGATGMTTGMKVLIGVGTAGVLGLVIAAIVKSNKTSKAILQQQQAAILAASKA